MTVSCAVATGAPSAPIKEDSSKRRPGEEPLTEAVLVGWRENLDHVRFTEREKASVGLARAGALALPFLADTLRGKSLEAADRAVELLEDFSRRADLPLRLAALEILVDANQFPAVSHRAATRLAKLQEEVCQTHFESLGAQFVVTPPRATIAGLLPTTQIAIDPKKWKGEANDFDQILRLGRVGSLKIIAPMVDDAMVKKIAQLEGLRLLTLVQTQASAAVIRQLRKDRPELRIVLRGQASLGISLSQGGGLVIAGFDPAGGPAVQSGLATGDVIQAFDAKPVEHFDDLTALIAQQAPGDSVKITVLRGEEQLTFSTQLGRKDWAAYEAN